jgi:hypothetical protein
MKHSLKTTAIVWLLLAAPAAAAPAVTEFDIPTANSTPHATDLVHAGAVLSR